MRVCFAGIHPKAAGRLGLATGSAGPHQRQPPGDRDGAPQWRQRRPRGGTWWGGHSSAPAGAWALALVFKVSFPTRQEGSKAPQQFFS